MMKVYVNIKNNSDLHAHQTLNKSIWLMKRESGCSLTHHFSFGERFDETLMKCYSNGNQSVMLSNHQFIGFSPLIKSAGKATKVNIAIRRLVGRTSVLPTDKGKPTPPQAFGNKSHSSLWRFLHAPLTLMLKTPQ